MKSLQNCIEAHSAFDPSTMEEVLSRFEQRKLKKGEFLVEVAKSCRELAFIEKGYLRMFSLAEGKEITLWIGGEGRFITALSSFIFQTENYWSIQALTDCSLQVISRRDHFELCDLQPKWLEFDNLLLARSFVLLEQQMFSQLHTTAQDRFEVLMDEDPAIFNHVPLHYIASMMGIAPETLSRLRKNLANSIS